MTPTTNFLTEKGKKKINKGYAVCLYIYSYLPYSLVQGPRFTI